MCVCVVWIGRCEVVKGCGSVLIRSRGVMRVCMRLMSAVSMRHESMSWHECMGMRLACAWAYM